MVKIETEKIGIKGATRIGVLTKQKTHTFNTRARILHNKDYDWCDHCLPKKYKLFNNSVKRLFNWKRLFYIYGAKTATHWFKFSNKKTQIERFFLTHNFFFLAKPFLSKKKRQWTLSDLQLVTFSLSCLYTENNKKWQYFECKTWTDFRYLVKAT